MAAFFVDGVPVAIPPPPGYVVDFDNPQRNSVVAAYAIFGVGNFLCLLFMLQRAYVKLILQKRVQIEDGCLFVAYAFSLTVQCLIIRDFARGIHGTHGWEMPLPKFLLFVEALYQLPILYNPVQCGAKLALLLLYRRLAPMRWFQMLVWAVGFVVVGSSVAIMFTTIFPCRPVAAAWDLTIENPTCVDRPAVYKATAILGAVTDALVLAVPIPIVLMLHVSRRQKIGLVLVFSIGTITVFTSIMRLLALINSMGNEDQSWGGGPVLLWILAETNLSCICGSLPTLKPFITNIAPRLLGSKSAPSGGLSNPSAPPTFGSGPALQGGRHGKYSRFDDAGMYPLETVVEAEGGPGNGSRRVERGGASGTHEDSGSDGWDGRGDGSSEKAIVQTRTTTVSYANRE